jgi:hypothetical protein
MQSGSLMERFRSVRPLLLDAVLIALLVAASIQIVVLRGEVQRLQRAVAVEKANNQDIVIGQEIRPLLVRGLGPAAAGRSYILMYLSPGCGSCAQAVPMWRELIARVGAANVVILAAIPKGGNVSDVHEYLRTQQLPGIALVTVTPSDIDTFRLKAVPKTLIVDRNSVVRGIWNDLPDPASIVNAWKKYAEGGSA